MKICRKIGLSFYDLNLTKDEAVAWKDAKNLPSPQCRRVRKNIAIQAFIRESFGGTEGALNALRKLEPELKKLEATVSNTLHI